LSPFAADFGVSAAAALTQAGIDPTRRPQTLEIVEIARLADIFAAAAKP
jgi:16S rRNA A1518/A1519 N6-dimethyltransferase RsmA/KsgA/DIM1 with predicted DNA glycosylase/AP lyase activity